MKKISGKSPSVNEPGLIESDGAQKFKVAIEALTSSQIDPELWSTAVARYQTWENSTPGISRTNRRLQLLMILSEAFPDLDLRNDPALMKLALSDLRQPGEVISARLPDGRVGPAKIIRQEITERLGVLYTLESQEGFQFTQEFFD